MIRLSDPSQCCGCTACEAVCGTRAITMQADALGFKYPVVDERKCTDCHRCEQVCQFKTDYATPDNYATPRAFGLRHNDPEQVRTSRSGAAFIALSAVVLAEGGVVYGAGYKEHFRVAHVRATTAEELGVMKGSKYVQSDLEGVFRQVREDLRQGLTVLFSGTPCQTAGLRSCVGKRLSEKLYLVDIVCHGVPAPQLWQDYLAWLERRWGAEVTRVNFRDKRYGWRVHREGYYTGKRYRRANSFTRIFHLHISQRVACGQCPYANVRRPSDLTLADFWGSERVDREWNKDDRGLSLVLVNTARGLGLLQRAKADVDLREYPLEKCMQNQLRRPVKLGRENSAFQQLYAQAGFEVAARTFGCIGWRYHVYETLSQTKQWIKKITGK